MDKKNAEQMLCRFAPLDALLAELLANEQIIALLALEGPLFDVALERLRRAHLERRGFVYLDEDHPASCCE